MSNALIVLKDKDQQVKIKTVLATMGFKVTMADTVAAGRDHIDKDETELIVIGKDLPDGDGIDFLKDLREKFGNRFVPILLLFKKSTEDSVRLAIDAGADDVLDYSSDEGAILAVVSARIRIKSSYDLLYNEMKKTHEEMEMARKVQEKLLPDHLPNSDKVRFAARYIPMEGVGGDFYDVISHEDDSVGLFISDVTGHGVHAAFTTMTIKTALNTWARGIVSPSETFILINNLVLSIMDVGRFVTAFYGKIDLDLMEFTYSNAGHPPALLFRAGTLEPERLDTDTGLPLGITSESVYKEKTVKLGKGDKLFMYTDGVDEARNTASEIYGEERFFGEIARNLDKDVDGILDAVLKDVTAFAEGTVFFDDINLLGMEIL